MDRIPASVSRINTPYRIKNINPTYEGMRVDLRGFEPLTSSVQLTFRIYPLCPLDICGGSKSIPPPYMGDKYNKVLHGQDYLSLTRKRSQVRVRFPPQKSLDRYIKRFFASLGFEQRGKLDQLGIEISSIDFKSANFDSRLRPNCFGS